MRFFRASRKCDCTACRGVLAFTSEGTALITSSLASSLLDDVLSKWEPSFKTPPRCLTGCWM